MKQEWTEELEYLEEEGMEEKDSTKEEQEERELAISFYMEELSDMVELTKEEEASLLDQVLKGEETAKQRLIEGNLKYVIQICAGYIGKGIPLGDLIQEGNIALLLAVAEFKGTTQEEFRIHLEAYIREKMEELLHMEEQKENVGQRMVERANMLSEVSKALADELGREPSAEELARRLSMTEDEIRDIMKMSLDALSVMTSGAEEESEPTYPEDLQEVMEELEQEE